jgi:hypothetical protein
LCAGTNRLAACLVTMASRDQAPKAEHATGVQPEDGDEENFPSPPKEAARLTRAFRRIENPAMRNAIIELLETLADNQ